LDLMGGRSLRHARGRERVLGEAPDGTSLRGRVRGRASEAGIDQYSPARPRGELRDYVMRRLFAFSDLLALSCALGATYAVKMLLGRPVVIEDVWVIALLIPLWVPIGLVSGLYHVDVAGRSLAVTTADELGPVFRTATIWSWCVLLGRVAVEAGWLEFLPSLALWALAICLVLGFRLLIRRLARERRWYAQKVVLVGRPPERATLQARIERHPEWGLSVVEQIDVPRAMSSHGLDHTETNSERLGDGGNGDAGTNPDRRSDLTDLATSVGASRVIFATSPEALEDGFMRSLTQAGIHIDIVAGNSDVLSPTAHLTQLEGLPVLSISPVSVPLFWDVIKRGLDLLIAVPVLLVSLPMLGYCAVRIKLGSPGPVLFAQERVGHHRRHFRLLKLRTMCVDAEERRADVAPRAMHGGVEADRFKAINDPRVTKVGTWLRRYSLDEIPQLWNVVTGDMSLVGPRPLPVDEDAHVPSRYEPRYRIRPGITGPWQVLGRSDIPFEEMLKLDYGYAMNWSLTEDLKLLVHTTSAVIKARGAY
jgi:exopolysaccharide biosynthesis polyprenyl glycosylphosphotransferase